jgi:hypothetical protein
VDETDPQKLLVLLQKGLDNIIEYVEATYSDADLETDVQAWEFHATLANAMTWFGGEENYHTGQVAFIRLASDPTWDYYDQIHGTVMPE